MGERESRQEKSGRSGTMYVYLKRKGRWRRVDTSQQ